MWILLIKVLKVLLLKAKNKQAGRGSPRPAAGAVFVLPLGTALRDGSRQPWQHSHQRSIRPRERKAALVAVAHLHFPGFQGCRTLLDSSAWAGTCTSAVCRRQRCLECFSGQERGFEALLEPGLRRSRTGTRCLRQGKGAQPRRLEEKPGGGPLAEPHRLEPGQSTVWS